MHQIGACCGAGSVHGRNSYLRYMPKCAAEREEQRKAARLALDTSTRGTPEYQNFLKQCSSPVRGSTIFPPLSLPLLPRI